MRYILVVKISYCEWRLVFDDAQELASFIETGVKHTDKSSDRVTYSIDVEIEDEKEKEDE